MGIELCQVSAARLSMEHLHDLHRGLLRGDIGIAGTTMSNDRDIIVEIDRIHLGQLSGTGNGLQNTHGHRHLDVSLYRASGSLLNQHGEGRNQHAVQDACLALRKSIVMRRDQAQLLILDPLFKSHDILGHLPDFFDASAAFDIKSIQNILRLCADRLFIRDIIGNRPHGFPVELLRIYMHSSVQVGFINIQIHHTRIGSADLRQIRIPKSSSNLRRTAPVLDLCLYLRIAAFYYAGDHRMSLSESLQIRYHLADSTAGIALS